MLPEIIQRKLRELPDAPGCYLMRDRRGRIIYVGKAASLRRRVRSYFRLAARRSADPKLRGLVHSIADFDVQVVRNEAAALLTESRLIKAYRPWYNRQLKDDKRYPLLAVDEQAPFPRVRLCRVRRADGAAYFGPYASSPAARAAQEFVEKRFGLRRCAPVRPGPADHAHCINDIVRFCAAPCIGKVTPAEYRRRVEEACAFLRGERPAIFREMREAMEEAARGLRFEKAAALRDTLRLLHLAVRQRAGAARPPGVTAEAGRAGIQALADALGLPRPPRLIEAYDVSSISGTHAVGSCVAAVEGLPRGDRYRRFRIKTLSAADDAAMMAELVRRRVARLRQEGAPLPDLILVDGGSQQVRAARAELERLGAGSVPVAGLAKRHETIVRERGPVMLDRASPALQVLQRLRDEAHRFALSYHRNLRARRLRESRLDDIPGVGATRRRTLLRAFGSVARVAAAPESELAAVPGIGPALARTLHEALARSSR